MVFFPNEVWQKIIGYVDDLVFEERRHWWLKLHHKNIIEKLPYKMICFRSDLLYYTRLFKTRPRVTIPHMNHGSWFLTCKECKIVFAYKDKTLNTADFSCYCESDNWPKSHFGKILLDIKNRKKRGLVNQTLSQHELNELFIERSIGGLTRKNRLQLT